MKLPLRLLPSSLSLLLGLSLPAIAMPGMDHQNHPQGNGMDHSMPGMNHQGGHAMHDVGPADSTYDLRFIDAMIQHHYGAIEMAKVTINQGHPGAGALASQIISAQSWEIANMLRQRQLRFPDAPITPVRYTPGQPTALSQLQPMTEANKAAMRMSGTMDMTGDRGKAFAAAMIPHHEMAIAMAEDALAKSGDSFVRSISWDIIRTQSDEIRRLRGLL
ncbi:DUF305 domain-containing protein [Synechococcus elongatus]|uniref:DUF305 domain-containing protein n=1 Tax=Synechococcus elongatus TaxID=32046 RepID=UPI000F7E9CE9|nr:DUF305 domain-containing protein [Synechococcus elongatus]